MQQQSPKVSLVHKARKHTTKRQSVRSEDPGTASVCCGVVSLPSLNLNSLAAPDFPRESGAGSEAMISSTSLTGFHPKNNECSQMLGYRAKMAHLTRYLETAFGFTIYCGLAGSLETPGPWSLQNLGTSSETADKAINKPGQSPA